MCRLLAGESESNFYNPDVKARIQIPYTQSIPEILTNDIVLRAPLLLSKAVMNETITPVRRIPVPASPLNVPAPITKRSRVIIKEVNEIKDR